MKQLKRMPTKDLKLKEHVLPAACGETMKKALELLPRETTPNTGIQNRDLLRVTPAYLEGVTENPILTAKKAYENQMANHPPTDFAKN